MNRKNKKDKSDRKIQSDPPTPIRPWMKDPQGNNIYIKREDEYGFMRGFPVSGSKVRIAQKLMEDCMSAGCDTVVAAGSPQSNMCSAIAYFAQKNGLSSYIVEVVRSRSEHKTLNHRLAEEFGAVYYYCYRYETAKIIKGLIRGLREEKRHPYLVYGDPYGKGNRDIIMQPYMEVYEEILQQQRDLGLHFDYIFIGAGTGVSMAGLVAAAGGAVDRIIGICIAHDAERTLIDVQNCLLQKNLFINDRNIHLSEEALVGGYGHTSKEIIQLIEEVFQKTGVRLDPVYTGKVFYGMKKYIKDKNIRNANILFIHTGGLANYFDYAIENGLYTRDILWRKGVSCADLYRSFAEEQKEAA
ncbi:MAG: pyridoxal-phosphate dependent enzyme [Lachnospiraceae bacterium]|nr:pyridoxal-phosphate dependent enzyme [Lachnospiraceae bacterium]